jgi:hypothetical protein
MNKTKFISLTASLVLATTLILSCEDKEAKTQPAAMTDEKIEADLVEAYENIQSDRGDWDKLNAFNEKILNYTSNYPSTLTCKFNRLENVIDIASSEDGLFRIYSWNTEQGGSMRDLENVFQFKSGDKVYVKTTNFEGGEEGGFDGSSYSRIFTVKADSKTYYLVIDMFIGSGKVAAQSISVVTIENNSLNSSVKLFKTKTKLLDAIRVDFDPSNLANRDVDDLIKYDPAEKKVYIPIVLEDKDGELIVSDKYIIYQFNGQYFEHILTQKK